MLSYVHRHLYLKQSCLHMLFVEAPYRQICFQQLPCQLSATASCKYLSIRSPPTRYMH